MKKLLKFQRRVYEWAAEVFGYAVVLNTRERGFRFLEESLELSQAVEVTREEALELVNYVYERPVGEVGQEIGGVMVTLAALANVCGIANGREDCVDYDIGFHAKAELKRIQQPEVMQKIREKQATKPKADGPLPGSSQPKIADYADPFYKDRQSRITRVPTLTIKPSRVYNTADLFELHIALKTVLQLGEDKHAYKQSTLAQAMPDFTSPELAEIISKEQQALSAFTDALQSVYRASIPPVKRAPTADLDVPYAAELHDALHHFLNAAYRLQEMKRARNMPGVTYDIAEPGILKARKNDATTLVYAAANKLFGRTV